MIKLLYPTSLAFDRLSLEGFSVELVPYDPQTLIPEEHIHAEILVAWTNSTENLIDAAKRLKNLRWIQSLAAGPNDVLNAGFPSSIVVTTGSGLHDHTVAEHALGLLLNACRRFYEMRDYQVQSKWAQHLGGALPDRPKGQFTSLQDANILVWGYGNIAKTLQPWLTALGARVKGIARSPGVRNGIEVYGEDKIPQLFGETDALVMILPGSDSTNNILNAQMLKLLPNHAWIINVGRGSTIDENALVAALEDGRIGGAALDVFATEPLPTESKLWKAPNMIVSPHAAGGRPQEAEVLVAYNLRRLLAGQEMKNIIQ